MEDVLESHTGPASQTSIHLGTLLKEWKIEDFGLWCSFWGAEFESDEKCEWPKFTKLCSSLPNVVDQLSLSKLNESPSNTLSQYSKVSEEVWKFF